MTGLFEYLFLKQSWTILELGRWLNRDLGSYEHASTNFGYMPSYANLSIKQELAPHACIREKTTVFNTIPDNAIDRLLLLQRNPNAR